MKLFTIGPVQMYPDTLNIRAQQIPYFRTNEFSAMMLKTDHLLKKIVGTVSGSSVIYLTASGTAAMEAAVMNCFNSNDKLLVVSGGTFGQRFAEICQIHEVPHENINLKFGEILTKEILAAYDDRGFTGMLVNLHETSTGQLYDIEIISDFCKRNNVYLVVDAISTFLCDEYVMDKYGIDVTILSSQKGFCLAPGLSLVILDERIIQDKVMPNKSKSLYFNFKEYIRNFSRGQTPFTPAVGILMELNDMLNQIEKEGVINRINKIKTMSSAFRGRIKELPATLPGFKLSNALTPVIFDREIALNVFDRLKNEYNVFVNPSGGEAGKRMIRVAHIGNITLEDHFELIELIKKVL